MTVLVATVLAAGVGIGVVLALAGLRGRPLLPWPAERRCATRRSAARLAGCAVAGLGAVAVTGWLVGAVLAVLAVLSAPQVLGGKAARQASIARTEAIASWTEMVRDSLAAASGLEEAIVATQPVAPAPIRAEVTMLVRRLRHAPLPDALGAFGDEVAHPSADLVVAALTIAARMEASDLTGLLSRLSDSIRDEARMRVRVEVGRASVRTAAKVILEVVVATLAFLVVVNRDYLASYDTATGQLVLAGVGGIFAGGGWLLFRMAALDLPGRFTSRRTNSWPVS